MSDIPSDLKYVASHEWIRDEGDGVVTIGITDHAQDLLGDVVFVELPEVGAEFATGDDLGVVESVKAASDVYAPLSGEILAINGDLEDAPELVNSDPYGDGWFVRLRLSDTTEVDDLLDADGYAELCEAES
ncbi:glycine cleavage system protein GcvH [Amphritea sp. 2_MG-2023]|jgi:glycine cleavage system H protein|uniref:glycine cleavage system protein GcvH n=1 Tax=Amphritea TaxID=515417 RepID=UPI001C078FEC|nr:MULTISPECIES: glycine cleavage system protein GcvH [Amphritea]MBU2967159.1 glycine cleavage system protein GcvH [Amphritea atlantica]MDO6419288.1 glycine cleavage system protein GcvH [Amphritea sp. 2_MG-2023]MDX2423981.1 glycine cleavage system protein GcvH [Amphritea sp.]